MTARRPPHLGATPRSISFQLQSKTWTLRQLSAQTGLPCAAGGSEAKLAKIDFGLASTTRSPASGPITQIVDPSDAGGTGAVASTTARAGPGSVKAPGYDKLQAAEGAIRPTIAAAIEWCRNLENVFVDNMFW